MKPIKLIYIAGRFRGPSFADIERNIAVAAMFRAEIAKLKMMPVCVHIGEGLAMHDLNNDNNGKWWLDATLAVLRVCSAVVLVPGWQTSTGTAGEIAEARRLGIPVFEAQWTHDVQSDAMPVPANPTRWFNLDGWDYAASSFADWVDDLTSVDSLSEKVRAALSQADGDAP